MNNLKSTSWAATGAGNPPVHLDQFRSLMREAGIEEIVEATVQIFNQEMPTRMASLNKMFSYADANGIRHGAHAMKSAAGAIHADDLADLLNRLEQSARAGDAIEASRLLSLVNQEFDAVMICLRYVV